MIDLTIIRDLLRNSPNLHTVSFTEEEVLLAFDIRGDGKIAGITRRVRYEQFDGLSKYGVLALLLATADVAEHDLARELERAKAER